MTDEAEALKRSARRRLIGAVALALVTVVSLPMIFDKEPPPLAEVEIVIPSRDTPGSAVLLEGGADARAAAAATAHPAPTTAPTTAPTPTSVPASVPSPTLGSPAVTPPVSAPPAPTVSAPAPAPAQKPAAPVAGTPAAKITLPEVSPPATHRYFLQLGVFSSDEGARKLAKRVAEAGFTVNVIEDSGRYKVRCGPVSTKPAAQELQTQLRGKGFTAVLVNS